MGLAFVWLLVWVIHSLAWLRGLMGGSVADVGLGWFSSLIWWRGLIAFGFAGVHGSGWGIDFRTLVGCLVCFDLWGCIFRLAFFGVRLLWVGFPFLDAWVDGGSMPGHVWGTLVVFRFMAMAGMVLGSLPVLGMISHCCLAFGFSFVAPVGDSFLGFASWLDRLRI